MDGLGKLILASESPQRRAILQELGIPFHVQPMDVDEVTLDTPEATVLENAKLKALAALEEAEDGSLVVAADTVLFLNGTILGKPKDRREARTYLSTLSGAAVRAFSGVAAARKGDAEGVLCRECATAHLHALTDQEIEWYLATEEPLTRAGAFGISRYGEVFVDRIEGSYSCIAGLPKRALLAALSRVDHCQLQTFRICPPGAAERAFSQLVTFALPD